MYFTEEEIEYLQKIQTINDVFNRITKKQIEDMIRGYSRNMEFVDNLYCPYFGHKGMYRDLGEGDYYDGPIHYCENCKKDFFLN